MASSFVINAWKRFETECVPPSAGDTQRREMKRAFFGGANALMGTLLKNIGAEDVEDSEELSPEDMLFMSDIYRELQDFIELVKEGHA